MTVAVTVHICAGAVGVCLLFVGEFNDEVGSHSMVLVLL